MYIYIYIYYTIRQIGIPAIALLLDLYPIRYLCTIRERERERVYIIVVDSGYSIDRFETLVIWRSGGSERHKTQHAERRGKIGMSLVELLLNSAGLSGMGGGGGDTPDEISYYYIRILWWTAESVAAADEDFGCEGWKEGEGHEDSQMARHFLIHLNSI